MITKNTIRKAVRAYYYSYPAWGPEPGLTSGNFAAVLGFVIGTFAVVIGTMQVFSPNNDHTALATILIFIITGIVFPFFRWLGALLFVILSLPFKLILYLWNLIPDGDESTLVGNLHRDFPMEMEEEEEIDESKLETEDMDGGQKQKRDYDLSQFGDEDYRIVDDDYEPISFEKPKRS